MSSGGGTEVVLPLTSSDTSYSLTAHVSYSQVVDDNNGTTYDECDSTTYNVVAGRRSKILRRQATGDSTVNTFCDSCGYELNLNSCNRNISVIDAKYEKSMKQGVISFFSIDESRFTQISKVRWLPYLASKNSWRLFQRRTKLLCRNCGNYIGTARNADDTCSSPFQVVKQRSVTWDGISARRTYEMRIRSLRPLSFEGSALLI
ncbi:putative protein, chloroplastic [Sesamum angolense]|uniref:Uncharacterized protein n=1 Tax=Sesamum angolense TaxID=2727404 RepID=A0AAE2BI77_9LAMI|nr:putative protein, chloroplastic [Sesamum angolense]